MLVMDRDQLPGLVAEEADGDGVGGACRRDGVGVKADGQRAECSTECEGLPTSHSSAGGGGEWRRGWL